ncbi:hypothetical protein T12_12163 [Trichinella patagoniensis]|uniref:Uncharacterized protein n=1 Tax=Trichinella patagoniensis TaxID=990121 RepID=A0A0V0ZIH6_9BILA|nr:hypothetical protein T12_12163 [Trichinella patagoniensis]
MHEAFLKKRNEMKKGQIFIFSLVTLTNGQRKHSMQNVSIRIEMNEFYEFMEIEMGKKMTRRQSKDG